MSIISKITNGAKHLDLRHGRGFVGHVIEKAEYLGASYAAARINTQFGEKAKFRGVEITYGGGVLAMALAVLADIFGYGDGWAPHLNTVSTAFVGTHLASIGARHGMEAAAEAPKQLGAKKSVLGMIGPAAPGKFLDLSEVNRLASMNG